VPSIKFIFPCPLASTVVFFLKNIFANHAAGMPVVGCFICCHFSRLTSMKIQEFIISMSVMGFLLYF
jgi:hypothetical protein